MARRICVPVDGSTHATDGLEYALEAYPGASITLLHVVDPAAALPAAEPTAFDDWERRLGEERDRAEAVLDDARKLTDPPLEGAIWVGDPAEAIVAYAEAADVDHLIVGSRGEGASAPLGSVAEAVVRDAPVLVSVVR